MTTAGQSNCMILRRIEQTLMPLRCVFCGTGCAVFERSVCEGCLQDLPWNDEPNACRSPPFVVLAAPLQYSFPVDAALKALKFRRRLDYVPAFAEILCRAASNLPQDVDVLLPVPLHWRRQAVRGFNQAVELSRPLHRQFGLPMLGNVRRIRSTRRQSGLDADERRHNLQQAFAAHGRISARHVLLVDDVITTGETCRQLAKVVLAAGAEKVSALAVARVP